MAISAEELQVLSFFAVEPSSLDKNVSWPYNTYTYDVTQGELSLNCQLAPAYQDVRLVLSCGGATLYEMNAIQVRDVRYRKDNSIEFLDIVLTETDVVRLRVRPSIEISQASNSET